MNKENIDPATAQPAPGTSEPTEEATSMDEDALDFSEPELHPVQAFPEDADYVYVSSSDEGEDEDVLDLGDSCDDLALFTCETLDDTPPQLRRKSHGKQKRVIAEEESEEEMECDSPPNKKRRVGRGPRAKYYCFTENDPIGIVALIQSFKDESFPEGITYCIAQLEKGKDAQGEHLQGYLELDKGKRLSWLKNNFSHTAHFEQRMGTQEQAIAYCQKDDTRVETMEPMVFGTPSKQFAGKRNDLLEMKALLDAGTAVPTMAMVDKHFGSISRHYKFFQWYAATCCLKNPPRKGDDAVKVILLIGDPGTGKTRFAKEHYPGAYWKPSQSKWWDGYQGERTVVFDDFNSGWFTWDILMRVLDRYALKVENKGGHIDFCATTLVLTTNTHPMYWYKNMGTKYPALARRITDVKHFAEPLIPPEDSTLEDLPQYGAPTATYGT